MEVLLHRKLKDSSQYNHLFPKAIFTEQTVKKNANVDDTVRFIPRIVKDTLWQVRDFVNAELKHLSDFEACEKLWHFVKDHFAYQKDEENKEQVRSPRRLFWEKIGDCDCYTVFLSACISAFNRKIKIIHRITKYKEDHFQHIYPLVVLPNNEKVILDCVTEEFNYEEPYTEKQDYTMDLNYLDGIPSKNNPDVQFAGEAGELGKLFDFLKKNKDSGSSSSGEKKGGKLKEIINKGLNVINKVNPATVLLRNGILAAMKLNFLKVPQRLKYAYLSDAEAQKRGVDMAKFTKLKQIREKIEKIFYGAGGKPENFKEAILTGRGNANREVPMSGFNNRNDVAVLEMNLNTPLEHLLGQEIFYSENMQGLQEIKGLHGLGEPVTAASIASATGIIAAMGNLLKTLGNIFPKKGTGSEDFENTADADKELELTLKNSPPPDLETVAKAIEDDKSATDTSDAPKEGDEAEDKETFWERNKKWLKPTAWGVGILSLLGISYGVYRHQQNKKEEEKSKGKAVSGTAKAGKKQIKLKTINLK